MRDRREFRHFAYMVNAVPISGVRCRSPQTASPPATGLSNSRMKKQNPFKLTHSLAAAVSAFAILSALPASGGLSIPYTTNANTLHLWHFDGATNTLSNTDEVLATSITLTNFTQPQVPGSQITLGNPPAIAQLGTCLQIIPTNLNVGNTYAIAVDATVQPDASTFKNSSSEAFTFEAIVKCSGNPYVSGNGNWEIFAGDNSSGARGWQFRIQTGTSPQLDFNFISSGGGNFLCNLPKSGPNILLQNIWYHVAVTYTGTAPTNGDTAGLLTFYWTVLDGGRTAASVLTNFPVQSTIASVGGTPTIAVGGSARNLPGTVANGEGFKGYIDEVRVTGLCLRSNEMAFVIGGAATPPVFLQQPPTNTFIGYGQTLTLPALVTGAPTYYWYQDGVYLPSQTDSSLSIPNATFAQNGNYTLIASNALGSVTSTIPAHVTIGATLSELHHTGLDSNGNLSDGLIPDPNYTLIRSSDINNFGPVTMIWTNAYPIAQFGGNFSNPDGISQWIGPLSNPNGANYTSPVGQYIYRMTFVADTIDLGSPATLSGVWWVNEFGDDILLNGKSTGFQNTAANSSSGKNPANFTITNGLVPGLNTLDFVTTRSAAANGSYQASALRVEMFGLGQARAAGLPIITNQPVDVTVRENGKASFSVVALGRPPLTYQWYGDNVLLGSGTNRTLKFDPVTTGGQASSFKVVVSNSSGSVTSSPAVLTLTTNRPPTVMPPITVATYSNVPVNISIPTLFYGASDPDLDPILFASFDPFSTNNGTITLNGSSLTYAPVTDYVGADQFTYILTDQIDSSVGIVNLFVNQLLPPTFSTSTASGTNVVFSGSGGAAGGSFTVLTATNLATPISTWSILKTGAFNLSGQFSITNGIVPGAPQNFFILSVP